MNNLMYSEGYEAVDHWPDEVWTEFFDPNSDNSSHQCAGYSHVGGSCLPCPDGKPLWWLVLRWFKMMLLKMATSYHAKPLILVTFPLLLGIAIGYFSQRWGSPTSDSTKTKFAESTESRRTTDPSKKLDDVSKEERVRSDLKSDRGTTRESGIELSRVPQHVAVIMDGNRRYGRAKYGDVSRGHWDGSSKLVEFAKWCVAEEISVLTVYAFSTENWNREPSEIRALMTIFSEYCDELRVEALKRNIRIHVLSTDTSRIPSHVKGGLRRMTTETEHCTGLTMNICMSYGSRGEILNASKSLAADAVAGKLGLDEIDENEFRSRLVTAHCGDPDLLIRTSGEIRMSNYLLWQLAYSEMFFLNKPWPAIEKDDFLDVIRSFAQGRIRRYGK